MISHDRIFLVILCLTFAPLPKLSSSQYNDSPRNIETYYNPPPYYSPEPESAPPPAPATPYESKPPPPPPPPPGPGKPSTTKRIMTVVGVTAASALAVAALVFLLVSRWSKSRRNQNGNENETTRSPSEERKVDKEGLDALYWNDLQKRVSTNASRVHPHPGSTLTAPPHQTTPADLVDVSLSHTQYSGDIVGALFGTVANNRGNSDPNDKVFILDPLKSRETATVLSSLGVSREDLIGALVRGKGVNAETLGKLTSITPTSDEQSRILAFDDDPEMLAEAEAFLYTLLVAFPSAFTRIQWRLDFDSDLVVKVMEPLRTLESGCDELRSRDTFLKLLQAVHNAAARLRAPDGVDKIPGFDLNTVGKLSEYKSTDGETTLLRFVVHQVVRNEGRRCVLTRTNSISRQNCPDPNQNPVKEDKEREFLMLGLPIVGGLSSEFTNARKAGDIDYDALNDSIASLVSQVKDGRQMTPADGAGRGFIESAELDIKAAQLEHKRVMNLVKKIAQYYQAGNPNPVQLFVVVKEFLSKIDQACVEIARSLQQSNSTSESGSDPSQPQPDVLKTRVNFNRLPPDFFS